MNRFGKHKKICTYKFLVPTLSKIGGLEVRRTDHDPGNSHVQCSDHMVMIGTAFTWLKT